MEPAGETQTAIGMAGDSASIPEQPKTSVLSLLDDQLLAISELRKAINALESKALPILGLSIHQGEEGDKPSEPTPPQSISDKVRTNTRLIKKSTLYLNSLKTRLEI